MESLSQTWGVLIDAPHARGLLLVSDRDVCHLRASAVISVIPVPALLAFECVASQAIVVVDISILSTPLAGVCRIDRLCEQSFRFDVIFDTLGETVERSLRVSGCFGQPYRSRS